MTYEFEFGDVFAYWRELVDGTINTLILSALGPTSKWVKILTK